MGMVVNQMRRKTSNKDLAKRAKKLVRTWQSLIEPANPACPVNGERIDSHSHKILHKPISPALARVSSGLSLSPALSNSRPGTPSSGVRSNVSSPGLQVTRGRPETPSSRPGTPSDPPKVTLSPGQPATKARPQTPSSNQPKNILRGLRPSSPAAASLKSVHSKAATAAANGNSCSNDSSSKTYATTRKRFHGDDSCDIPRKRQFMPTSHAGMDMSKGAHADSVKLKSGASASKEPLNGLVSAHSKPHQHLVASPSVSPACQTASNTHSGGTSADKDHPGIGKTPDAKSLAYVKKNATFPTNIESDKARELRVAKTPKVKTTAQLIEQLKARTGGSNLKSDTVKRIKGNLIEKEVDDMPHSVVPAGAKPRPRKKPGSLSSPAGLGSLSSTKSELVEKFLQTSVTPSMGVYPEMPFPSTSSSYSDPFSTQNESFESSYSLHDSMHSHNGSELRSDVDASLAAAQGEPPEQVDPYSLLPPLNLDEIDWGDDDYEMCLPFEVTDEEVDRLSSEQWKYVNGMYDHAGIWHDWTSTLSLSSYNGELLHILPYVNIDD